jgi:hypothetical protein
MMWTSYMYIKFILVCTNYIVIGDKLQTIDTDY